MLLLRKWLCFSLETGCKAIGGLHISYDLIIFILTFFESFQNRQRELFSMKANRLDENFEENKESFVSLYFFVVRAVCLADMIIGALLVIGAMTV